MSDFITTEVQRAGAREQERTAHARELAQQVLGRKFWPDLTPTEKAACVRHIVSEVESEEELRDRLESELRLTLKSDSIFWNPPEDDEMEGPRLVQVFGMLLSKSNASVSISISESECY